jgi:hypothetical protein
MKIADIGAMRSLLCTDVGRTGANIHHGTCVEVVYDVAQLGILHSPEIGIEACAASARRLVFIKQRVPKLQVCLPFL